MRNITCNQAYSLIKIMTARGGQERGDYLIAPTLAGWAVLERFLDYGYDACVELYAIAFFETLEEVEDYLSPHRAEVHKPCGA